MKHIVVNLTTFRASYYEDDKLIKEYPVGIQKPAYVDIDSISENSSSKCRRCKI
jgi:hypothetical protein